MPGAGSATRAAFAKETSFLGDLEDGGDGTTDYWAFGRDPTFTELNLDRQLARLRDATSAEAVESIAGKLDGAVGIEAAVTDVQPDVHDIVFVNGTEFLPGRPPFSRIFTGVQHLDGTVNRELRGCIPLEYTVSYDEDSETVTYSLSMGYATEPDDPSPIDASNITQPTTGETAAFHGFSFTLDGASVSKLSTCEVSVTNIARYHYGPNSEPIDATIAAPETEITANATFTSGSKDRLQLAYGGTSATSPQDRLDAVTADISISGPSGELASYEFDRVKPNNQSWNNVIAPDDTADSTTFHANGGIIVV
jgi:hypothetical protein